MRQSHTPKARIAHPIHCPSERKCTNSAEESSNEQGHQPAIIEEIGGLPQEPADPPEAAIASRPRGLHVIAPSGDNQSRRKTMQHLLLPIGIIGFVGLLTCLAICLGSVLVYYRSSNSRVTSAADAVVTASRNVGFVFLLASGAAYTGAAVEALSQH